MTVLTQESITDSGRSDLRDILDGQPGITLGTGENGNAFGDRYVIRGQEARSDMFVDGLRDPGMTIRESFALEQVEVTKGPSSTFAGRGSTGGAVNSVTKQASTEFDFTELSGALGTDSHHRVTADTNIGLRYDTALRVNVMHSAEDVPGRAPANRERQGAAFSLTNQPTDSLDLTFDYYHFDGKDKPDLGTYIESLDTGEFGSPVDDIPVYVQDEDFLESTVDTATFRLNYELSPRTRLVNLLRYGTTDNGYVVTGARGNTAYLTEEDATNDTNGFASIGLSTHQGWQEVEYIGDQFNIIMDREIGGKEHDFVFGLGYSKQQVLNGVYSATAAGATNCWAAGRGGVSESYCLLDENGNEVDNLNNLLQRDIQRGNFDSDWNVQTVSLTAMDTVELNEQWDVFGGLRYDYYDYRTDAFFDPDGRDGPEERALTSFENTDGFLNGHLGVTYAFQPNANVYASLSTATNINGGESDVGTSCGYGGICVDGSDIELGNPEQTLSVEVGTKWNLADGKLLASAAVFQMTKSDVMEQSSGDSYSVLGTLNTGKHRVQGMELGLSGNITPKLSVQAGLSIMDAEILESINEESVGGTLANFADISASLQAKYRVTGKFYVGGGLTHEGARYTGQPDSAANEEMEVPAYTIFDAFAGYDINRNLKLRLNIGNLTDKKYYLAAYRSGSFTYLGDARNARLTVSYDF